MDSLMTLQTGAGKKVPSRRKEKRGLPVKRHYAASFRDLRQRMAVKRRYFCKSLRIVTLKTDFLRPIVVNGVVFGLLGGRTGKVPPDIYF
jgi:hypothetical protein